ncbi:hypothetical protein EVAR_31768_1 [Eumeta japonica]|uniref:Uncharacterized protein n=1 Tax=Eumeta variegata TaxID=151549 RepID=A0A4C1W4D5_EUMVA|nr:hypothetical protein EVAR_31768_1 [Eumeta japonica]
MDCFEREWVMKSKWATRTASDWTIKKQREGAVSEPNRAISIDAPLGSSRPRAGAPRARISAEDGVRVAHVAAGRCSSTAPGDRTIVRPRPSTIKPHGRIARGGPSNPYTTMKKMRVLHSSNIMIRAVTELAHTSFRTTGIRIRELCGVEFERARRDAVRGSGSSSRLANGTPTCFVDYQRKMRSKFSATRQMILDSCGRARCHAGVAAARHPGGRFGYAFDNNAMNVKRCTALTGVDFCAPSPPPARPSRPIYSRAAAARAAAARARARRAF